MTICHIMLDIETLGVRPGFVVLSAAFVRFEDMASTALVMDHVDQTALGLEMDPATVEWWQQQSPEARAAAIANPVPLRAALDHFAAWLAWAGAGRETFIWCHGASFDAPMMQEVYRRAGVPCPWSFRNVRDTRTLFDLSGVDLRNYNEGTAHNALDDARAQTRAAVDALRVLAERRAAA